jgi:hypothetical protein
MVTKNVTDSPRMGAAAFIQVPLGRAIVDPEIRRIATARGIGMTNHQDAAAGLEGADGVKTLGCAAGEVRQTYPCQNYQQDFDW